MYSQRLFFWRSCISRVAKITHIKNLKNHNRLSRYKVEKAEFKSSTSKNLLSNIILTQTFSVFVQCCSFSLCRIEVFWNWIQCLEKFRFFEMFRHYVALFHVNSQVKRSRTFTNITVAEYKQIFKWTFLIQFL